MRHETRPTFEDGVETLEDTRPSRTQYPALIPNWQPKHKPRVKQGSGIAKRYFVHVDRATGRVTLESKRGWAPNVAQGKPMLNRFDNLAVSVRVSGKSASRAALMAAKALNNT